MFDCPCYNFLFTSRQAGKVSGSWRKAQQTLVALEEQLFLQKNVSLFRMYVCTVRTYVYFVCVYMFTSKYQNTVVNTNTCD